MLDTPFVLPCGLSLSNRIVKASMTERLAAPDGRPNAELARLYERFAAGGASMLLTGNVVVDAAHLEGFGNAVLDSDEQLTSFADWAAAGKAHDVPILVQLNHPGRQAPRTLLQRPVAPSPVSVRRYGYFARPRALAPQEIEAIIEKFAHSAVLAERAGFAGVEVHAAHGYLLSQFLSPNVNRRTDAWGGSLENRARILLRIIDRIRERVSPGFAVGVKLNAGDFVKGGFAPHEAEQVMRWLDKRAIDFIEISGGTFERPASFGRGLRESTKAREGYFLELAAEARKATSIPLIVTGGFRSESAMQEALARGACDFIGMARPLAVEPDLPKRLLSGVAARAAEVKLTSPCGPVGDLAELYWYRDQLARVSAGSASRGRGFTLFALARQLLHDFWRALVLLGAARARLPSARCLGRGDR
jgi:2,4-dienoyl-CoA reductase-like NADH-dependent reductase (Old Yellow Enzyme family)